EGHIVARHHGLRIGQPSIERAIIPDDARRFERVGITVEAWQRSGLSPPKVGETWPGHVATRFERVAGRTDPEVLLTTRCVPERLLTTRAVNCRNRSGQGCEC